MAKKDGEALGISGFTLGIMSLVLVIFSPILGVMTSIVGFVFCVVQQRRKNTRFGKSGMIINVIGFLVNIIWMVFLVKYLIPIINEQLQLNPVY
ncbi:hypothetical protein COU59_02395 [Candidatus Pacearchaeota archaeon CG10_big_fil_rev_8_21_14_0_10_34_12]|nr:MAG: hypothetical protein COU59_02395 [Candidatus Pacearchaeota archaeon CG10_big_fil_rev_8_21_14_0_10_34_12]